MKILNLKQFLALKPPVLFFKYQPCVFEEFGMFTERCNERDFFFQDLVNVIKCRTSDEIFEITDTALSNGSSFETDFETEGRDGMFEDEQLFAVFEKEDVQKLINRISQCL